jgi:cell division protein FtsI/penicillin-binding protein 2
MKSNQTTRIRIILGLFVIAAVILAVKLYDVQILQSKTYSQIANRQYVRPDTVIFDRGSIYFQSKDGTKLAVATVKDGFAISINPKLITDPSGTYDTLAKIFATSTSAGTSTSTIASISPPILISKANFLTKAANQNTSFQEIATKVDTSIGTAVSALAIPGVSVYEDDWRYYPGDSMASQVIGLTGESGETGATAGIANATSTNSTAPVIAGQYGIERSYDNVLTRDTNTLYVNFFAQLFSNIKSTVFENQPLQGDVVSTIDPTVQNYLEQEIVKTEGIWKSDEVGGIVIDPNTGAIVAMGHWPDFNGNDTSDVTDPSVFSNPLVENIYEMGSIIKPLTMSAGIDSGAITASTTYDDTGCITVNGSKICNYDGKARGVIPMQQILSQSLNVGASWIATTMGIATQNKYFRSYGLGSTTGIDLPNEAHGDIVNLDVNRQLEHDEAAFGQGIAMSPIETVRALSAIANGGLLVTPHVVSEIDYTIGGTKNVMPNPAAFPRVLKKSTTDIVTHMLVNVVDQVMNPAKPETVVPHYSIASKTGTAQIANPAGGGYYTDRYLHSFFTYFPASNPRYLVFMYQVYPKGAEYASATLTDPVFDITKFLINYYTIPPDR